MFLLGDINRAAEGKRSGLVNRVVPEEELDAAAEELAAKFLEKSALGVHLIREAFYQCVNAENFEDALKKATEMGIKSWETEDAQEGLNAFLEKRAPVWKNK